MVAVSFASVLLSLLCSKCFELEWLNDNALQTFSRILIIRVLQINSIRFFPLSGAFLIPFAVMLVLEGIPLFLIELGIGQKMRLGSLGVWNTIHPWLGGIGISSCMVTLFVTLYYNVVITWCFFYFLNSFRVSTKTNCNLPSHWLYWKFPAAKWCSQIIWDISSIDIWILFLCISYNADCTAMGILSVQRNTEYDRAWM